MRKKLKRERIQRLMSIDDLADYLGLQRQTIYNWLHNKKISGIKIGKVWRFDKNYIDDWLSKCHRG